MAKIVTIPERHLADARSRTIICLYHTDDLAYIHEQTKNHDIHDRFDCLCVFEFESLVALRSYGKDSAEFHRMNSMRIFNLAFFADQTLAEEMESLGLVTSIDRAMHGKRLLKHFLHE